MNKLDPNRPLLCRTCKRLLPITEFVLSKNAVRANAHCKECKCKQHKYRVANEIGFKEAEAKFKRDRKRRIKMWAIEKLGGKCTKCGLTHHPAVYDFHHLDPKTKEIGIGSMITYKISRLEEELAKCILVCANCHREIHFGEEWL